MLYPKIFFDLTKGNLSFIGKTRHHQDFHLNDAWFMFSNPSDRCHISAIFVGYCFMATYLMPDFLFASSNPATVRLVKPLTIRSAQPEKVKS